MSCLLCCLPALRTCTGVPFPTMPANLTNLSDEELRAMEGTERRNVEARVNCLRNIQTLLDAAVAQMHQYLAVSGVSTPAPAPIPVPTPAPATSASVDVSTATADSVAQAQPSGHTPAPQAGNLFLLRCVTFPCSTFSWAYQNLTIVCGTNTDCVYYCMRRSIRITC